MQYKRTLGTFIKKAVHAALHIERLIEGELNTAIANNDVHWEGAQTESTSCERVEQQR